MHGYVSLLSVLVLAWCLAVRTDLSECSERVNFFEIHVCVQTFHVTVHRNSFKFVLYSRKSNHFFFYLWWSVTQFYIAAFSRRNLVVLWHPPILNVLTQETNLRA